jgi:hypothetical protein
MVGKVTDELGDPVAGVEVILSVPGAATEGVGFSRFDTRYRTRTDHNGLYRLDRLPPAKYLVSVAGSSPVIPLRTAAFHPAEIGRGPAAQGYPTTFHPRSLSPETALLVAVGPGERVTADIQVSPVSLGIVRGVTTDSRGPAADVTVCLFPTHAVGGDLEFVHAVARGTSDSQGRFVLGTVPVGDYVVRAWRRSSVLIIGSDPLPKEPSLWATSTVTVAAESPASLVLSMEDGVRFRGYLRFKGNTQPALAELRTLLQPVLSEAFVPSWPTAIDRKLSVRVDNEGGFVTEGVPSGLYQVRLPNHLSTLVDGWHVESVTLGGRPIGWGLIRVDGAELPELEITFSDRPSGLAGAASNAAGQVDSSLVVVVLPADFGRLLAEGRQQPWFVRTSVVADDGSFRLTGLLPGDYLVSAIPETDLLDGPSHEKLQQWSNQSERLTVRASEVQQVTVRSRK